MPDMPDDIVEELRRSIRPVVAPLPTSQMKLIDPWAHISLQARSRIIIPERHFNWRGLFGLVPWILGAGLVIAGLLFVSQYGNNVKDRVVKDGNAAISHLIDARDNLEELKIDTAKDDLEQAREKFDSASRELDILGPTLVGLLSHIPGLSSLRTGQAMLTAGRLLSDAGNALGDAIDAMSQSGISVGSALTPLDDALTRASDDVSRASALVEDLDIKEVPDEYQEQFTDLRERLPIIRGFVNRGVSAVSFLSEFTGTDHPRRYLVLFSNSSELRPTGGFPGSFGLLTFEKGAVKDFHADDIYNPDGQISELIVPPIQLQHITPGWGMRDVAWWIDGPMSSKKVMEYWKKGGGAEVDGVLSIRPELLAGILNVTGPVPLPEYGTTLTEDNVIQTLQQEVESKKTKQPKQIIVDLAPVILQRLRAASASQWVQLLALFKDALDARDITMFFSDGKLQQFASAEQWDGSVRQTDGDYLLVDVSNIKGAKTDAVTDTAMKLESWIERGAMIHRLTLTRQHNGGSSAYGFYNKTNYSWVRVLVPEGSTVRGISGNDQPNYKPLMAYTVGNIIRDPDLEALEGTYLLDARGVTVYKESGKTGFGFWTSVKPGATDIVQLEYEVPAKYISSDYKLTVQRQSGLDVSNFEFTLQKKGVTGVASALPSLVAWPDSWRYNDSLDRDLDLSVQLK